MPESRLEYLFNRYASEGALTPEEEADLMNLLANPAQKERVQQLIDQLMQRTVETSEMQEDAAQSIMAAILQADKEPGQITAPVRSIRSQLVRWLSAAAVLVLLAVGIYWWNAKNKEAAGPFAFTVPENIKPGGNKAVLTLADGRQVILDTAQNGVLQTSGAITIRKTKDGELVYDLSAATGTQQGANLYNTISTPNGGQYQVLLPDGSKVWLNAASSIRFPMAFAGKERKVVITGEAYLEVAQNARMPFMVEANETKVEVLGTHFNINSYTDERYLKTTLLEGSVRVVSGNDAVILKPGQQALSKAGNIAEVVYQANLEETMAWKNGFFYMSETPITAIIRQISRWYSVEIAYPEGTPVGTISGKIPRSMNFSNVLKVLQKSGVVLKMEGQKLVIHP